MPREKVVILTKTNAITAAGVKADIDRFRKEIGVDYIDILLMHKMEDADWNVTMKGPMDVISDAQHRGIVRPPGTACQRLPARCTSGSGQCGEL